MRYGGYHPFEMPLETCVFLKIWRYLIYSHSMGRCLLNTIFLSLDVMFIHKGITRRDAHVTALEYSKSSG
jgi:hypothetical protein